jgi:hypothetical protein
MPILSPSEEADGVGFGIEGSLFRVDPSPAYGSELSTGGGRLVRALTAMEPSATRFPFPLPSRTIGE